MPDSLFVFFFLAICAFSFGVFWIWAIVHALQTPSIPWIRRLFWALTFLLNPLGIVWYWCVWKRWAFWALLTPLAGIVFALPFGISSVMTKADETAVTNALFALGNNRLVIFFAALLVFPIILRLITILHLSRNPNLQAPERNDWAVSIALPCIGIGAAFAYVSRNLIHWAFLTLVWLFLFVPLFWHVLVNITALLIPAGDAVREAYLQQTI